MNSENEIVRRTASAAAKYLRKNVVRNVIVLLAGAVTAFACAWSGYDDHSVRFNDGKTGRAFYRLPPLPIAYEATTGKEISTREIESEVYNVDQDAAEKAKNAQTDAYAAAQAAVEKGDLAQAKLQLEKYLELTVFPEPYEDEKDERRVGRNTAYDLLDALSALRQGARPASVQAYMKARYEYDSAGEQNTDPLRVVGHDRQLDDNWAYLKAAKLNASGLKAEALDAFRTHATSFPRSEKHDAVLYMIAKLTMEESYSFTHNKCGVMGKTSYGEDIDPATVEPTEKCQDENWSSAIQAFRKLMQDHPNGRYHNDARGWLAFLYKRGGERVQALAEYYSLLGDPTDRNSRLEAKRSLERIGHEYDDATLDEVENMIAGDPHAALAYAYHRIYNHAIDLTYVAPEPWCYSSDDRWQERQEDEKRVSDSQKAGNHELERVAKFATAMLKRYPRSSVGGDFVLRTAQANLELQKFQDALELSEKALNMRIQGDMRMEGLWVKGSSEHQLKKLKAARATFNQLITEFPHSKVTEGAERLLAMTAEDQDDLETALDMYLKLKYQQDVAYFIDVLMPTDRLAEFIRVRKSIPQYNQLLYALGVRYMRDERWNDARQTLSLVKTETGTDGYLNSDENATSHFPKETVFDDNEFTYIKASWVMQDLKTIDVLEYYEKAVENAEGDDAKAEAMYQLASCLFESDDLVFYNPAAWGGERSWSLSKLLFSDHERLPNESRIIYEDLEKHDPWARAIPIYLEIADRYPATKVARDALYSAAVAHERLSERIYPWVTLYGRGLFAGPRMVTYADVRNTYPDYQLPRGTYGWQPSTRTVNGGPGWEAKPKPPPKLSITQRIERKLKKYGDLIMTKVSPKIEKAADDYFSFLRGLIYGLIAIMTLFAAVYAVLIATHVRTLKGNGTVVALQSEHALERLPGTESRIEKVIDDR